MPQRFRADDSWILREEVVGQIEPEKFNLFQEPEEFAMNDGNSTDGSMPGEGDDAGREGLPPASPLSNSLKKQAQNVVGLTFDGLWAKEGRVRSDGGLPAFTSAPEEKNAARERPENKKNKENDSNQPSKGQASDSAVTTMTKLY